MSRAGSLTALKHRVPSSSPNRPTPSPQHLRDPIQQHVTMEEFVARTRRKLLFDSRSSSTAIIVDFATHYSKSVKELATPRRPRFQTLLFPPVP